MECERRQSALESNWRPSRSRLSSPRCSSSPAVQSSTKSHKCKPKGGRKLLALFLIVIATRWRRLRAGKRHRPSRGKLETRWTEAAAEATNREEQNMKRLRLERMFRLPFATETISGTHPVSHSLSRLSLLSNGLPVETRTTVWHLLNFNSGSQVLPVHSKCQVWPELRLTSILASTPTSQTNKQK